MIKIKFGKSRSQNYNLAVRKAKNSSSKFEVEEIDNKPLNIASFNIEKSKYALKLWELVKGWKSSELLIEESTAFKYDIEKIIYIKECSDTRLESLNQEKYCYVSDFDMHFSCRKLKSVLYKTDFSNNYYFYEHNLWYKFGSFDDDKKTYIIDKPELFTVIQ